VISSIPVENEAPKVTSGISRPGAQSFGGAHRGRVYVRVFMGGCRAALYCVSPKKIISICRFLFLYLF
jgi:hypothetical protein